MWILACVIHIRNFKPETVRIPNAMKVIILQDSHKMLHAMPQMTLHQVKVL